MSNGGGGGGGISRSRNITLIIGARGLERESNFLEIVVCKSFANLTFDPCFKVMYSLHAKGALYLPYFCARVSKI